MNIFFLGRCPYAAAEMQGDRHVVKMPLEAAQLLCTAHRFKSELRQDNLDALGVYKSSHANHPLAKWTMERASNYCWLLSHYIGLCEEFRRRRGKYHKCENSAIVQTADGLLELVHIVGKYRKKVEYRRGVGYVQGKRRPRDQVIKAAIAVLRSLRMES